MKGGGPEENMSVEYNTKKIPKQIISVWGFSLYKKKSAGKYPIV
jgi:hypothetical protein